MLTDNIDADDVRRSGILRSGAHRSGMRGLEGACCSSCAGAGAGLGDLASIFATIKQSKALDALFLVSLTIGAVAGGLSIYSHFKKRSRRRHGTPRVTSRTMQIPTESMHDLVYGREAR